MAVHLLLYGSLRKYSKNSETIENSLLYPFSQGITVAQILDGLEVPEKNVSFIRVNKNRCKIHMTLRDEDCIELFPRTIG